MCALRDSRSIPAISLACQYRLNVTPKRPTPRKVLRRRKDGQTAEVKSKEKKVDLNERRVSTQESEEEDYDFDGMSETIKKKGDYAEKKRKENEESDPVKEYFATLFCFEVQRIKM